MGAGLIATAVCGTLMVGVIAGIVRLVKGSERKKHLSDGPLEIRFRPRGLFGVALFIFSLCAGSWIALLIAMNAESSSGMFAYAVMGIAGAVYPFTVMTFGEMFVVSAADEETPSRSAAPTERQKRQWEQDRKETPDPVPGRGDIGKAPHT